MEQATTNLTARRDHCDGYARNAGKLLALSTLLGLIDLHYENVLACKSYCGTLEPIPVDLEMAFWDCISVTDTNLVPSNMTEKSKAGLNAGSLQPYNPKNPSLLLDAFLDTSDGLAGEVGDILTELEASLRGHPIRVLLRPTKDYRVMLRNSLDVRDTSGLSNQLARPGQDLLKEELLQLKAGDIPYFFTLREPDPKLYCFTSPAVNSACDPEHFTPLFRNATRTVAELSQRKRIERLRMVSALHIFKAYHATWPESSLEGEHFTIVRDGAKFSCSTPWFRAQASVR